MCQGPPEWLYQNIIETSKHASRIHVFYIAFVLFCTLTLFGTSDRQIILDEQTILPVIGNHVSFSGFCFAVTAMGICIFAYFQIYLQKYRSLTLKLKADYPQVSAERIYPWFVTIAGESQRGIVGFLQRILVEISLWYLTPIFLSIIPFWLVRAHRPVHSYISALTPIAGIWLIMVYRSHYERISFWHLIKAKKALTVLASLIIVWSLFLSILCIPWAMSGKTLFYKRGPLNSFEKPTYWDLEVFLGSWWCVDLSRQNLVKKPETDYPTNYWVNLLDTHLEGANLSGCILEKADLADAHLQNALLFGASFKRANLNRTDLTRAMGWSTNFEEATFSAANFEAADFSRANFRKAWLGQSNFQKARLSKAIFEEANLYNCKLQETNLWGTNFKNANLKSTKLHSACLNRANLQGADMKNTILDNAYLFRSDLRGAKNLKTEQLCKAASLWAAKFDEDIEKKVQENCPELLNKPKIDSDSTPLDCHPDSTVVYP